MHLNPCRSQGTKSTAWEYSEQTLEKSVANSKIAETRGGWFMLSSNLCSWYEVPVEKWGVIPTSAVRKTAWGWIFVDVMAAHQNIFGSVPCRSLLIAYLPAVYIFFYGSGGQIRPYKEWQPCKLAQMLVPEEFYLCDSQRNYGTNCVTSASKVSGEGHNQSLSFCFYFFSNCKCRNQLGIT